MNLESTRAILVSSKCILVDRCIRYCVGGGRSDLAFGFQESGTAVAESAKDADQKDADKNDDSKDDDASSKRVRCPKDEDAKRKRQTTRRCRVKSRQGQVRR